MGALPGILTLAWSLLYPLKRKPLSGRVTGPMLTYDTNAGVLHYREATTISLATGLPVFFHVGGTATFRVQTTAHVDVSGQTWPVMMNCIAPGYFIGVLDATVAIDPL